MAPLLAKALAYCRGWTLADVREGVEDGRYLLWVVTDPAVRAAVVLHPDERAEAVTVWLMAGDGMDEWLDDLIAALTRYAADIGYSALQAVVRPGLSKVLNARGWKTSHVIMRSTT